VSGEIKRYHLARGTIVGYHVDDRSLAYTKLSENAIQLVVEVPLVTADRSVAADAVGTPVFGHSAQILRSEHLKHLEAAQLFLDFAWAATADGTIQLYDETVGAVLAETSAFTGGESDDDLAIDVTGTLVAGNRIVVRANVTVAGAAGETVTVYRAILKLVLGVS